MVVGDVVPVPEVKTSIGDTAIILEYSPANAWLNPLAPAQDMVIVFCAEAAIFGAMYIATLNPFPA